MGAIDVAKVIFSVTWHSASHSDMLEKTLGA